MLWNIRIYQEPADFLYLRHATSKRPPVEVAEGLIAPALAEGRRQIALLTPDDDPHADPVVLPEALPNTKTHEELLKEVDQALQEGHTFLALALVRGALEGPRQSQTDIKLLAASVFEMLNFLSLAEPLLRDLCQELEGKRKASMLVRLAETRTDLGREEGLREKLSEALEHPDLSTGQRVLGLALLARISNPEEAEELLDEALDLGEEELGDHLSVARALEVQAELLSSQAPEKAVSFYLAAGQMLQRLAHPRFYEVNQKLAIHHLRCGQHDEALDLSQVMFEMLQNAGAPSRASIPYYVIASEAHRGRQERKLSEKAMDVAMKKDPAEVARVLELIRNPAISETSPVPES